MQIEFDTPIDPQFPMYTRANAGEVLPRIVPPLGWTLIGPAFEAGFRATFERDLATMRVPTGGFHYTGRLAGRFVLNLSLLRRAGARLIGTSAGEVDRQYLGDASTHGLPSYDGSWRDPLWYAASGPATLRTMATIDRRVGKERALAEREASRGAATLRTATDADLVERLRSLQGSFARVSATHVTCRALSSPALALLEQAAAGAGAEPGFAMRVLADLPGLESSAPSRALARIASELPEPIAAELRSAPAPTLAALEASATVGAQDLAAAVREFVGHFGHRGVNEFDPTSRSWEQDPESVVGLVATLVRTPARAPTAVGDPLGSLPRRARVVGALLKNAQHAVQRGERTKATAVLVTNEMRRAVFELARRWAERLPTDDLWLCSLDEVASMAAGGPVPLDAIARRRAELDAAAAVDLDEVVNGTVTVHTRPAAARTSADATIQGIGGSTGAAKGRVRVMTDPFGEFDPGEVLVAAVTDTAWTPLFLSACAVVTDVGGLLSHATIVARDLGIPAVINTKTGTAALRTGDLVEVDGDAGTVRVLEPAP